MLQIAVIGVVTVLLALQFRERKSDFEIIICICGGVVIMGFSLNKLGSILRSVHQIQSYIGLEESYYQILIKIVGITYLSEFTSDVCKDTGHASVGCFIELAGKLSIMALSMPIILALLDTIRLF